MPPLQIPAHSQLALKPRHLWMIVINAKTSCAKMINAKMTNTKMLYEKMSCAILHPMIQVLVLTFHLCHSLRVRSRSKFQEEQQFAKKSVWKKGLKLA